VNLAAAVIDDLSVAEQDGCLRDAGAARAEMAGDLLLRERQSVVAGAVLNHQEPTAQAFFHRVTTVADGPLGELVDLIARVSK
jgi:hypothetical protein